MLASKWGVGLFSVIMALINANLAWNIFPSLTKNSIENFTREKLANLRNQRKRLELRIAEENAVNATPTFNPLLNDSIKAESMDSSQNMTTTLNHAPTSAPASEGVNSTSEILRENIIQQILPNKEEIITKITEVGDKLVEMRERLEPEVKKFLTKTYNSFLSNLVPYSETIGVPTYVINSLKIPQNFDPRLQFVESLLKSVPIKNILNSFQQLSQTQNLGSDIQGKSDDQDLVSDQEPAGMGGQMKYSQKHRSLNRGDKDTTYLISDRNGYEFGYDDFSPSDANVGESLQKGYYVDEEEDAVYDTGSDLAQAAGHNVARGHNGHSTSRGDYGGGGYGHGGGGSGSNGLTDPFTILGGLAFLTYLAMLIQQQMNANTNGREEVHLLSEDTLYKTIPLILNKLKLKSHQLHGTGIESAIANLQKQMTESSAPLARKRKDDVRKLGTQLTSSPKKCQGLCRILKKLPKLNAINSTLLQLKQNMHGSNKLNMV